jgi:phosphoribosylanthranilate isomerase
MSKRNFNDDDDGDGDSNRKLPARPDFCTGVTMNDSREEGAAPSQDADAAGRSQAGDDENDDGDDAGNTKPAARPTGRAVDTAAAFGPPAAEHSDGGSADPTARSSSLWERRTFAAGSSAAHDGGGEDDDGIRASLDAFSLLGPFSGGPLAAGPWMRNDMPTEPTTGAAAAAPLAGRLHERYGVEDTRQDDVGFFGGARLPPIAHRRPRKVRLTRGEMDLPTGIQRGLSPEEVQARLASYPEEVRRHDEAGRLPVHVAAAQPNPSTDVVRLLVTAYPDALQVHDNNGRTPLNVAAESFVRWEGDQGRPRESSMESIEFLATADPRAIHVPDNLGRTPWDVALEGHRPDVVQLFATLSPETLRARDGDGRLPLHAAVARGRIDMVQILATLAPDALQAADNLRRLPLHVAAASATVPGPWAELVRYLLAHDVGAVRARDAGGRTPLLVAAESGASLDVLYELLRALHDDVLVPSR